VALSPAKGESTSFNNIPVVDAGVIDNSFGDNGFGDASVIDASGW